MACCFHKTQFAQHGLEYQMSNCRMTKLQTLLRVCFGQVCPICRDFPPVNTLALSVYPSSCRPERGAEHSMGLLYDTVRQEREENGAGFCHREHKHQEALTPGSIELLQCHFSSAKNYITFVNLGHFLQEAGREYVLPSPCSFAQTQTVFTLRCISLCITDNASPHFNNSPSIAAANTSLNLCTTPVHPGG